jgi:hypothetical protein
MGWGSKVVVVMSCIYILVQIRSVDLYMYDDSHSLSQMQRTCQTKLPYLGNEFAADFSDRVHVLILQLKCRSM